MKAAAGPLAVAQAVGLSAASCIGRQADDVYNQGLMAVPHPAPVYSHVAPHQSLLKEQFFLLMLGVELGTLSMLSPGVLTEGISSLNLKKKIWGWGGGWGWGGNGG